MLSIYLIWSQGTITQQHMKLRSKGDYKCCDSCPIKNKTGKVKKILYYTFLIVLPAFVIIHTIITSL